MRACRAWSRSTPRGFRRSPATAPLFSALLFPVADDGVTPVADDAFREAELYDNGMARLVHGSQSDEGDSIQLAWDDEQIAEWFNRQVDRDGAGNLPSDAPLGVAGYRVDVRRQGDPDWNSLVRVESRGDLSLGPHQLGAFAGESVVEAIPMQVSKRRPSEYWMPSYFCSWRGSSLVLIDEDYRRLHEHPDLQTPELAPRLLNREQLFRPVDDKAVPLEYGNTYEFRVRLADLTRGGPASTDAGARSARPLGDDDSVPAPQGPRQDSDPRAPVGRRAAGDDREAAARLSGAALCRRAVRRARSGSGGACGRSGSRREEGARAQRPRSRRAVGRDSRGRAHAGRRQGAVPAALHHDPPVRRRRRSLDRSRVRGPRRAHRVLRRPA